MLNSKQTFPVRLWARFLAASSLEQIFLLIAAQIAIFAVVVLISGSHTINGIAYVVGLDDTANKPFALRWLYAVLSWIIVTAGQAVIIARILIRPHHFRFSEQLLVTGMQPSPTFNDYEPGSYLVFRIINEGETDIYDLVIDVSLRFYDSSRDTYVHYPVMLFNGTIRVFRKGMPFRIYAKTGQVLKRSGSSQADVHGTLDPLSQNPDPSIFSTLNAKTLIEKHDLPLSSISYVVFVRGFDASSSQTKASVRYYDFTTIIGGDFKPIACAKSSKSPTKQGSYYRLFEKREIDEYFDRIVPDKAAPK